MELEDRVQLTNQLQEQVVLLERRCSLMTAEEEELRGILEQTDRARKMAETELTEASERANLLTTQVPEPTGCSDPKHVCRGGEGGSGSSQCTTPNQLSTRPTEPVRSELSRPDTTHQRKQVELINCFLCVRTQVW